ncbi:maleylacetoacetate isomerase [Sphingobium sp. AN558]|uniref:maleylacetoacetate isomerase n=1 Tax=Sphingobium sp. AN558 TaxID=3133442 RepID=UPI0030BC1E43
MSVPVLHGYWRSSAVYRVRIALGLKAVAFDQVAHDLLAGEQRDPAYRAIAPHGLVPALEVDGAVLIESPAILEWIDQRWPAPSLLPADPLAAATVRAMAALIACDIHPINNLRVLKALKHDLHATGEQIEAWTHRWIGEGFAALDSMIEAHGGTHAFGDGVTLADCYLVPQLYNARRSGLDLSPYPHLVEAGEAAERLPAVAAAHPDRQPGANP